MIRVAVPWHMLAMQSQGDRLKRARIDAGYTSAMSAAKANGWKVSTYAAHENTQNGFAAKAAARYARAFRTTAAYLLTGERPPNGRRMVSLVGYVGAGAETFYEAGQGPLGEVDAPDGATEHTVAVEVRGSSLGELFDSWLVFYDEVRDPPERDLYGRLCVCGLANGRVLIKKLTRGQLPGRFNLLSNTEPPMYDQDVAWAARVKVMTPR